MRFVDRPCHAHLVHLFDGNAPQVAVGQLLPAVTSGRDVFTRGRYFFTRGRYFFTSGRDVFRSELLGLFHHVIPQLVVLLACKYIIVITVNEPSPLAPLTPALGAGGVGGVGCFLLVPIII